MATLTYYCGESGFVRKYDHSANAWSNASIGPNVKTLYDIMAFPGNPTKVIAVGDSISPSTNTIWYSTNGGSTWTASTINPSPITATIPSVIYEVWVTDATYVYAVGYSSDSMTPVILESIDGGLTFNHLSNPASASAQATAVHFPTSIVGVVAISNKVYYTINGGTTWIPTNGDLPIEVNASTTAQLKGVHIFQETTGDYRITVLADQGVVQSTDSGVSYITRYSYGIRIGEHLTWFGNSNFWSTDLYGGLAFSDNGGATWGVALPQNPPTQNTSANIRGAHFYKIQSTSGPVTTYEGFLCSNVTGLPPLPAPQVPVTTNLTTQNTSAVPLIFPANIAPFGTSDALIDNQFYAVWTEYENTLCVRLKECNGTKEIIIKDIAEVGTGVLLSSFGVGASVTIDWSAGNNVSPCLLATDNFPKVCWTIEEIIEDCEIVGTCEEVIP